MSPTKDDRRRVSVLIPYRVNGDEVEVFIQKRKPDAKRLPDWFGFFGGGCEGTETPEQTLVREIREELEWTPIGYAHFRQYERPTNVLDAFIASVGDDFTARIRVTEGEYGKWLSITEALRESKLTENDKQVLRDLADYLKS